MLGRPRRSGARFAVSRLAVAPVKGLGLVHPDRVDVGPRGVRGDRRFYFIDSAGRVYDGLRDGRLLGVRPEIDVVGETASLRFPDGVTITGSILLGERVETYFYGRKTPISGHVVDGPWSEALSGLVGRSLRFVRSDVEGDVLDDDRTVTIVSVGSVAELGRRTEADVDARRFRMTFELEGCEAHEEDSWIGLHVRIGEAVVIPAARVARCAVTTRDPETGERDLDTLRIIASYRPARSARRNVDFGVSGRVATSGIVRVGDEVAVLDAARTRDNR